MKREQKWIDEYSSEYNILKTAGSSLGYKHTPEGLTKITKGMSGKTRSRRVRREMSARQKGENNTFFGKSHTDETKALFKRYGLRRRVDPKPGFGVEVFDKETNTFTNCKSLRAAATALGTTHTTLRKYHGKTFLGQYYIKINK